MDDDIIANNYIDYLKLLPVAKLQAFFYGSYSEQNACLHSYLKTLHLTYSDYKRLKEHFSEIDSYVKMSIDAPAKKTTPKPKVKLPESDDESF